MTGGDHAEELVSRLRAVWPEPRSVSAGRRGASKGGATYLVLPSLRRPVLLVPANDAAAAHAIRRVDDGQRSWLVLQALAWGQQRQLLRLLPWARVRVEDPGASAVVGMVRAAVPGVGSLVVRLGRRRHGRAVVLQVLSTDGRTLAFAKCAAGERGERLRREHASLVELAQSPVAGVRPPRVLDFRDVNETAVLVLEALVPRRPALGRGAPVAAMRALAARSGVTTGRLASAGVVDRLRSGIEALEDDGARAWMRHELERLLDERGEVAVTTGAWHGDWVGWNMARDGDCVLLWDWEHAETGVPLGVDHVHHLAQELRGTVGTAPHVEDKWLGAARQVLRRDWGVLDDAADATLRTYLLMINLRYLEDREGDPQGPARREGWSRELLARLGGRHDAARTT